MSDYETVETYTIEILKVAPHWPPLDPLMPAVFIDETEENLTDLLPAGYRARIRRWDHPDPDEGENDDA